MKIEKVAELSKLVERTQNYLKARIEEINQLAGAENGELDEELKEHFFTALKKEIITKGVK